MLELPHTIIGATIATKIPDPLISLPLAFLSAFLSDMLPHWNPHLNTEIKEHGKITRKTIILCFLDAGLGLIVGLFLAFRFWPDIGRVSVILLGCFLAVIPDVIEAPYFFLGWRNKYLVKIISIQKRIQFNVPLIPGLLSQAVILGICFWLLSF